MSDWTIIFRSMTARLFSTVTTIITVAVAVALLLVLLTMRGAAEKSFQRGSGDMHLLVSADDSSLVSILNGVFYANPPRRPIPWAKYQELSRSFPFAYAVPTQQGDSYAGLPVMATSREFFTAFKPNPGEPWQLADGEFFDAPYEVVVGSAAAAASGLKVGDTLFLTHGIQQSRQLGSADAMAPHQHTEFTYTVVGVLEPTGGSHDRALFTDLTSSWVIHAHDRRKREDPAVIATTEADLIDADRLITGIYLRLITRPGSDAPANLPQVFDRLRRDPTITVAQPAQEIDSLFKIVDPINRLFVAIAVVVVISSGIAIMLALYNSMEQRRRQIATLRVMGASRGRIFGLVLTESAILGIAGAAAGVLFSLIGAVVAAGVLKTQLGLVIEPGADPRTLVVVVIGTVALAAVAGLIPSVMAYQTSVAKNLRPLG